MSRPKLLILAFDAAQSSLLMEGVRRGDLPTLASLIEGGLMGSLTTPPAVLEGAIWPTLITGTSPASHGMFSSLQIVPGTYRWRAGVTAERLPFAPFWEHLSEAGQRVVAIDVPFAKPVRNLNGIHVCNWGAHDAWSYPRSSWPADVLPDLVSRFGDHPIPTCDLPRRTFREFEIFKSCLITGIQKKTAVLSHYLQRNDWDFFFGVYSESHCAGHQAWHLTDPSHPRHDPSTPATLKAILRDTYRAIDKGIGRLLQRAAADTHVMVISSHGMGPWYAGSHLLAQVLEKLDMSGETGPAKEIIWSARRMIAPQTRERLKRGQFATAVSKLWHWTHRNPIRRMRAFSVPSNNMTAGIRLNVQGREPDGIVRPGREYEKLCAELSQALLDLENPHTGRRAVLWVAHARDLYQGPRLDEFPDLFVEWDHSAPIDALRSARIGEIRGTLGVQRTGDHRAGGLLVAHGARFRRGSVTGRIRTMDLAPTI
ncbi:MAG TPA: alkaline phosphatase family protein, partial [Nitrospirales bacterium]|nr:alkaline phosphatase family protein [Nitrospirales bacterium]